MFWGVIKPTKTNRQNEGFKWLDCMHWGCPCSVMPGKPLSKHLQSLKSQTVPVRNTDMEFEPELCNHYWSLNCLNDNIGCNYCECYEVPLDALDLWATPMTILTSVNATSNWTKKEVNCCLQQWVMDVACFQPISSKLHRIYSNCYLEHRFRC